MQPSVSSWTPGRCDELVPLRQRLRAMALDIVVGADGDQDQH